jgi:hypothetical protein
MPQGFEHRRARRRVGRDSVPEILVHLDETERATVLIERALFDAITP